MYVLRAEICLHNLLVLGFINRCTQASNHIPVQPVERCSHNTPLLRFMSRYTQVLSHNCYACSTCGKMFTQDSDLEKHERIHTGDKLCVCSTCGKMFTHNSNPKRHERFHTGIKPYACSTCGKMFARYSNLKVHERIHTGVKSYACSTCRCLHKLGILKSMNVFTQALSRMHVLHVEICLHKITIL